MDGQSGSANIVKVLHLHEHGPTHTGMMLNPVLLPQTLYEQPVKCRSSCAIARLLRGVYQTPTLGLRFVGCMILRQSSFDGLCIQMLFLIRSGNRPHEAGLTKQRQLFERGFHGRGVQSVLLEKAPCRF